MAKQERERERESKRERRRQTDRQADSQAGRRTDGDIERKVRDRRSFGETFRQMS